MPSLTCARCQSPLPAGARYCTRCGAATRRHRRESQEQYEAARQHSRRYFRALAAGFLGTLVALILLSWWEPEDGVAFLVVANLLFLAVGGGALLPLAGQARRETLGGAPGSGDLAMGAAGGLLSFGISWLYVELLRSLVEVEPPPLEPEDLILAIVGVAVLPALVEEWLCRGVLWRACREITSGRTTLLATAFLFAVLHVPGDGLAGIPHRLIAGLIFGWLRSRSGSLAPGMLAHFLHNSLAIAADLG